MLVAYEFWVICLPFGDVVRLGSVRKLGSVKDIASLDRIPIFDPARCLNERKLSGVGCLTGQRREGLLRKQKIHCPRHSVRNTLIERHERMPL